MKAAVDTNILVRAVVKDDERQSRSAAQLLKGAEVVAVSASCLCEFVWVLRSVYAVDRTDIAATIETLLGASNIVVDRPAIEAGLAVLKAGGDFADGVNAHEGSWLGGETFVSFDRRAVSLIAALGREAELLT